MQRWVIFTATYGLNFKYRNSNAGDFNSPQFLLPPASVVQVRCLRLQYLLGLQGIPSRKKSKEY